jgi:hypothetical protein
MQEDNTGNGPGFIGMEMLKIEIMQKMPFNVCRGLFTEPLEGASVTMKPSVALRSHHNAIF